MKPFEINVPQSDIDDLHRRLDATRWPSEPAGASWAQGTPLSHLTELAEYWRHGFDWREQERRLNKFPQFVTEIDGTQVHFLHVRSANPDAEPLLLTHGWPSTGFGFSDVVEPLSADFHVIVPTVPGFGFSGPTRELGWSIPRVARAYAELMTRLGYDRYVAHGYDYGAILTRELAMIDDRVRAIHLNQVFSAGVTAEEADMTVEAERLSVEKAAKYELYYGYALMQGTRPQSVAYGLTDSPVAQLEWIEWAFHTWSDPETRVDRDTVLTNVSIYWFTRTAGSSARYYQEGTETWGEPEPPLATPLWVSVYPHDLAVPIRRIAERNHQVVGWTEVERGGHFAAMEVPELAVREIRQAFRS